MLRIHFTGDDLARVRMAVKPDALWETILSFHRLRERRRAQMFGEWRSEARARLNGETSLLSALVPPRGYFPDFLTPPGAGGGLEAGLEAIRATAPERLRAELDLVSAGRNTGSAPAESGPDRGGERAGRLARLAGGAPGALARLVSVLRGYHRAAVEPYWGHVQARVEADRAVRGRALLDGGAAELLGTLPPVLRWRAPVLEADYPVERELRLDGRGLLLQPSFFCRGTPVVYRDATLPPVLVYPVAHTPDPAFGEGAGTALGPSLGRLVGHTRSAVLQAIRYGCTTSELARRAGVSLASASQHAAVLREAGLVLTLRHGNSVLHTLTPLGAALLRGGAPAEVTG
ncbi:ArsR/SmtB family transcription factor [Streptomyces clavuligerus]|uniref:ArsR/SmtB family transcription factor n=4 Tax=Streptomyces clavuligerus TaxID=1901 RepID=UPI0003014702|nr:winged helix-turn-helix domain-containing protein [Streptomyces clavuligerus]AXU14925.1 ArsR family transcriptional regulator [Streptomyces clavuligerus]MBY6304970.1 winged helix-turn-helix transcriptional regulator [Streptomyces clavuligerus]QCS07697.1 ArsR family transcriptional regulator [Streptomyces clavuligerus]QPJ92961.1 helix-turn-helix domain-containing protein [Streptomyces clavuligerus]QPL64930.1 winged helix-turn-helix transcriptional regulator [Streptomyces clavuligerus]